MPHPLYIYIDESGDLNFSETGTSHFTLTAHISLGAPTYEAELFALRDAVVSEGIAISRFHATEDKQHVRDRVFSIITNRLGANSIESLIVEKRKTVPLFQDLVVFYSKMMGWLLRYRLKDLNPLAVSKVVVITDRLPTDKAKRRALEKAIKAELAPVRYRGGITHEIYHEPSEKHAGLQVADYCNWAVYRKWSKGDLRSYELIRSKLRSEFDIFHKGTTKFY